MTIPVEIFGRNIRITERTEEYVDNRASKLDRYLAEIDTVRVDLEHAKSARSAEDRFVAQITVRGKRVILRSEERSDDIYQAFDLALDKVQRQISRYKGKRSKWRGDGKKLAELVAEESLPYDEVGPDLEISRRKKFTITPMDEQEALDQMQLLGHENFFIFFNANTNGVNVLYKRNDGTYGIIEPEVG